MATKKTPSNGLTLYGLKARTYAANFYNINVRAFKPKNREAEVVYDLALKINVTREDLQNFMYFDDLYEPPTPDMLAFDPGDLIAREPTSINYGITNKDYNVLIDGVQFWCQHGITLVGVELSENKGIANPGCVLLLSLKGIPWDNIADLPSSILLVPQGMKFELKDSNYQEYEKAQEELAKQAKAKPAKEPKKKAGPETGSLELMAAAETPDPAPEPSKPKRSHHKKPVA